MLTRYNVILTHPYTIVALFYRSCPWLCNTIRLTGRSLIWTKSLIRAVLRINWHRAIRTIENPLYHFFHLDTYPEKFMCLPRVMVQEQLVSDYPRVSYKVTYMCKGISLRIVDMSDVTKALDEAELTEDNIPCAARADPLESHTVPALKWWLLCHCTHACETCFHLHAFEMLVSTVVFYRNNSENNARISSCLLRAYCPI